MPKKIIIPIVLIIGGIAWLAFSNLAKANAFFKVDELPSYQDPLYQHEIKIMGRVLEGSINKIENRTHFTLVGEEKKVPVVYVGDQPLPDLFQENAEAVAQGRLNNNHIFEANHIQAKCSSKYEAEGPNEGASPNDPGKQHPSDIAKR